MTREAKHLRRLTAALFAAILVLALYGCAASGESQAGPQAGSNDAASSDIQRGAESASSAIADNSTPGPGSQVVLPENPKILIAYFSRTGHVTSIAEEIREQIGGDVFEIVPAAPYTEDINELSGIAQNELREGARPALEKDSPDIQDYDVVFVGYPCWWGDAPMPVYTFLEEGDYSGRAIVPFTSYGESGWGRSLASIESSAPGSTLANGLALQEHHMDDLANDVAEWLRGLGIE